ncbi:AMP-binding protein [Micromonospora sp. M12]
MPSSGELAEFVRERGVTVLWLTAGLFRLMVDLAPHAFAGVRQVLTGGDVVPPEQVRRLLERFPGLRVTCGYGPTENTTFSTVHHLDDPSAVESPLPIGRPIAGTGLLILDHTGREVPPGGVGELYVTGAGLAIDYLGAPDQTRAAFGLPARTPVSACTGPATWCASTPTTSYGSWAGPITRSRFAATASRPRRSWYDCWSTLWSGTPWWSRWATTHRPGGSWPAWSPAPSRDWKSR